MNQILDELEETKINLFNQLKNSCVNWQDGNSRDFEQEIYLERNESDELYNEIKEKKEVYDLISNRYSELGQKVLCDLDQKDSLLNCIREVNDMLSTIINDMQSVTAISLGEPIKYLNSGKENLNDLESQAKETFIKIKEYEKDINSKIKGLTTLTVQPFDFDIEIK